MRKAPSDAVLDEISGCSGHVEIAVSGHRHSVYFRLSVHKGTDIFGRQIRRIVYLGDSPAVPNEIQTRIRLTNRFSGLGPTELDLILQETLERRRENRIKRQKVGK